MRARTALVASLLACVVSCGGARPAAAQGAPAQGVTATADPAVSVTRSADAQDCPDTAALVERVTAIRGNTGARANEAAAHPSPSPTLSVTFGRSGDTFFAAIRSSARSGSVRRLEVAGKTCAPLARATAVTVALLLDPDSAPDEGAAPAASEVPPPPSAPPAPIVTEGVPASSTRREPRHVTIAAGVSAMFVTLRPVAEAFAGEVGLEVGPWRTGLGVLWAPAQSIVLGPGVVRESLWAGSLRLCASPWRGRSLRSDVCAGAYIGLASASGEGYTTNEDSARPWLAVPIELALAGRRDHVGWELAAGALVSIIRQEFSIEGLGDAYHPPSIGALISARAVGLAPW